MSNISPEQSSLGLYIFIIFKDTVEFRAIYIFIIYPKQGCIKIPPPQSWGSKKLKTQEEGKGRKKETGKRKVKRGRVKTKERDRWGRIEKRER